MRRLAILTFLLLCASPCFAQLVLTANLAGQVNAPIDQNGWQSFKVTLTQNITFSFVILPLGTPPPAQSTLRVIFVQDATGGRTVTFASNIVNPCTITGTSSTMTICQFMFDGGTSTWQGIASGGGSPDPPVTQNYTLTATGAQAAINLTAAPIDTHSIQWRLSGSTPITDTIPYANGDLHTANTNWVYESGTFTVSSNKVFGNSATGFAYRNDGVNAANEFSQATVVEGAGSATQNHGPCVRMQTAAATAYCVQLATDTLNLVYINAGANNTLQSYSATFLPVTGDVIKLVASGTTLSVYKNGICLTPCGVTDSNIASGFTGIFNNGNASQNGVSAFQSGPLCTIALDSSPDSITWTTGGMIPATDCSAGPSSAQGFGVANYVRVNPQSLAAGTLTVVYSGRLAPASNAVGTAAVSNGQWVIPGEVIWTQLTSQNIGNITYTSVAKIIQPNGAVVVTNYTVPTCGLTGGGFGSGFTVTTAGWLQSTYTQVFTGGLPQGSIYVQHYILESMPTGGSIAGCVNTIAGKNFGTMLDGNPTGSFYTTGFTGTTVGFSAPWSIPGFTNTIAVTNPAAGADWSVAISESAGQSSRTCIQSVSFTLATSASAANRIPVLVITMNGSKLVYSATTAQTATTTQTYSFSPGASAETVTGGTTVYHIVPFNNGQLACFVGGMSTAAIGTLTTAIQAADQYSAISILTQVQQDNN